MRALTMDTQEALPLAVETVAKSHKTDLRTGKRSDLVFETVELKEEFNNLVASFPGSNKAEKAGNLLDALKRFKSLSTMTSLGFSTEDENRLITALGLTPKEQELLDSALQLPGNNFISLLKTGLMAEVKRSISHSEKLNELKDVDFKTLSSDANINKTFRGLAALKIQKAIEVAKAHNETCQDRDDKIYISESVIARVTGSNRQSIRDYFTANKAEIDAHNRKHDLDNGVNRKGKGYDFKATLGL